MESDLAWLTLLSYISPLEGLNDDLGLLSRYNEREMNEPLLLAISGRAVLLGDFSGVLLLTTIFSSHLK